MSAETKLLLRQPASQQALTCFFVTADIAVGSPRYITIHSVKESHKYLIWFRKKILCRLLLFAVAGQHKRQSHPCRCSCESEKYGRRSTTVFLFWSRCTGWVTPKMMYFYYEGQHVVDQSIPKNILFNFEDDITDQLLDVWSLRWTKHSSGFRYRVMHSKIKLPGRQ